MIEKYPELAGLVENKNGVLTLDIESKEVHIILTGEGCEINALSQVLDELKAPWKIYVPQTNQLTKITPPFSMSKEIESQNCENACVIEIDHC